MFRRKHTLLFFLALTLGLLFVGLGSAPRASALTLSAPNITNDLIDDPVFRDSSTMTASQIQAFLNAEGSGLANVRDVENCGSSSGPHYAYYTQFYSCGTVQVAAQIIYDAARAYGINPEAILATLQKEQSLITTPNPTSSQINFAMGYGCPDSGGCSFPGFFNQVDNGAWQFRTDIELGSGNNWWGYTPSSYPCNSATRYYSAPLKAGNTVTFTDDNGTAYETFTLTNMSTATLYCYTPHVYNNPNGINGVPRFGTTGLYYSGSYNFVYYFTLWFGSTTGELVRTPSNGQVYIVNSDNNTKYPVDSLGLLNDFSTLGLRFVDDAYLAQFTTGQAVGNMVQGPDGTLYLVNAGIKLPFTNCSGDVVDYGYACSTSDFIPLTAGQTNKLVSGPAVTKLVKSNTDATIYYVSSGQKHPIPGWNDLLSLNTPLSINVLTSVYVGQMSTGTTMYAPGSLVKTANSATVYVVKDSSNLFTISSFVYPQELGLPLNVRTMSNSDLSSYTVGSGVQDKILCGSNYYVGSGGQVFNIASGSLATYGFNAGDFVNGGNMCNALQVNSQTLGSFIRVSSGTIYMISGGQKQAFTNFNAYIAHGGTGSNTVQVSDYFASLIPSGSSISQ